MYVDTSYPSQPKKLPDGIPFSHSKLTQKELFARIVNIARALKVMNSPSSCDHPLPTEVMKGKIKEAAGNTVEFEHILSALSEWYPLLKSTLYHSLRQELLVALQELVLEPSIQQQIKDVLALSETLEETRGKLIGQQLHLFFNADSECKGKLPEQSQYLHELELSQFETMIHQTSDAIKLIEDKAFRADFSNQLSPVYDLLKKLDELIELLNLCSHERQLEDIRNCFSGFLQQWETVLQNNIRLTQLNYHILLIKT